MGNWQQRGMGPSYLISCFTPSAADGTRFALTVAQERDWPFIWTKATKKEDLMRKMAATGRWLLAVGCSQAPGEELNERVTNLFTI